MTTLLARWHAAVRPAALAIGLSAFLAWAWGLDVHGATGATGGAPATTPTPVCPAKPSPAQGRDFKGRQLDFPNFAHQDLTNADFRNTTLKGAIFVGAILSGADFSGAIIVDSGRAPLVTDFTLATLDSTCFIGARFAAPAYFTYATLTCADFSNTDLTNGNAIFGDAALRFDPGRPCRTAFRSTAMNCELRTQWKALDLSNANISLCITQKLMAGLDLSNAMLDGVNLFQADLEGTILNSASLRSATLSYTNLKNAKLIGAHLGAQTSNEPATTLIGVYAPGVDFTNADLRSVDFSGAHLYRSASQAVSFAGARLDSANFSQALLPEAVFTGSLTGAVFNQAVLVNAVFTGADLTNAKFIGAYLQGTDYSGAARIAGASLGNSALSTSKGSWSYTEKDGTPTTYGYAASILGDFALSPSVTCPNAAPGPCVGEKLTPSGAGPYPAQPACTPLPPQYDNCLPPVRSSN